MFAELTPFAAVDYFEFWAFLTVVLLTFAIFLVITGAFTAYFGSGKSRKIGAGLLVGGLALGIFWGLSIGPLHLLQVPFTLTSIVFQTLLVILAAVIGAAAAIGLFLLAIMKS